MPRDTVLKKLAHNNVKQKRRKKWFSVQVAQFEGHLCASSELHCGSGGSKDTGRAVGTQAGLQGHRQGCRDIARAAGAEA